MKRCVIVGGADISDYKYIRSCMNEEDFFIFCDSGLKHLDGLNVQPNLIVGDFDSHENPNMDVETIVLPCEKDDTDTVFAVKEAIKRGYDKFLLIGVIGARLDHTLGNVSILAMLDSIGKEGCIIDDYSDMRIISDKPVIIDDSYAYFSLLNVFGEARGIYESGVKYPLENAEITCEYQYGVSNEILPGRKAKILVKEGRMLLICIRKCI